MKKIIAALLALASAAAFSATLTPIQLLNPAGSTSGQAVVSTGASSAPAWGNPIAAYAAQAANTVLANVTASSASPTAVAIPSCSTTTSAIQYTSGTGFSCGTGFAALSGSTFTGASGLSYVSPTFTINDSTGANAGYLNFNKSGVQEWSVHANSAGGLYIDRYVSGAYADTPFSISSTNGTVGMGDGIVNSPISGSTGSFTTLAASGLISPTSTVGIKGTTTNDSPAAGSVGENPTNATTSVSMTSSSATNCTSQSLTAGNWMVGGVVTFLPSAAPSQLVAGVSTTSATLGSTGSFQSLVTSFTSASNQAIAAPVQFLKLPSTTTVYLIGQATFGSGTTTCYGNIYALRIR